MKMQLLIIVLCFSFCSVFAQETETEVSLHHPQGDLIHLQVRDYVMSFSRDAILAEVRPTTETELLLKLDEFFLAGDTLDFSAYSDLFRKIYPNQQSPFMNLFKNSMLEGNVAVYSAEKSQYLSKLTVLKANSITSLYPDLRFIDAESETMVYYFGSFKAHVCPSF